MRTVTLTLALVAVLGGCASPSADLPPMQTGAIAAEASRQQEMRALRRFEQSARLFRVASRVNAANADLCTKTEPAIGLNAISLQALSPADRAAFLRWVGRGPIAANATIVAAVAPASPAETAGLARGDLLLGADSARIAPERVCAVKIRLDDSQAVNAFADGESITVTSGMMRFAASDADLAIVYGHELAHDVMGHVEAKRQNRIVGTVAGTALDVLLAVGTGIGGGGAFSRIGGSIGGDAYSVSFEKEADYVGLYYAHRAGYDVSAAPEIWRRMAAYGGAGIEREDTHPTSPERALLLQKTLDEIALKSAAGLPLSPNVDQSAGEPRQRRRDRRD